MNNMGKIYDYIHLYLAIMNTIPKWLAQVNMFQGLFMILCVKLLYANDLKVRNIRHNEFVKKFRIVVRDIEIETPFGKLVMQEVRAVPREKKE